MTVNVSVGQCIGNQSADNFQLAQAFATSTAAAATINLPISTIVTESVSTAAGSTYTFTLTNSIITANSFVAATVGKGSYTTGTPCVANVTSSAGQAVIVIQNIHASAALNGTLEINVLVVN